MQEVDGAASNLSAARYITKQSSENSDKGDELDGIYELDGIDDGDDLDEETSLENNSKSPAESQLSYHF